MTSSAEKCPACGAVVTGGRDGCQAVFDQLTAHAYADLAYASVRDLAFDTYCMQHLETYCRSAKSYAAHLTRLCCGLEYAGNPRVYEAIQHWLNGTAKVEKPQVLGDLGSLTVMNVRDAPTAKEYIRVVRAWAANVWEAYRSQHDFARTWIETALAAKDNTARR
ncbi:MAG TPA: DUF5946 family protein [Anaerolineae bacterium]|nr:DUF5946 family protein [Anaerolineae bacterium]